MKTLPVSNTIEISRLREGDVIELDGREFVVEMTNPSRARCIPLERKQVEYTTVEGKEVKFVTDYAAQNISPNSEVPILRRLGPNWRALTGQKQAEIKTKPLKVPEKQAPGLPRKRKS